MTILLAQIRRFFLDIFSNPIFFEACAIPSQKKFDNYRYEYFSHFTFKEDFFRVSCKFLWKLFENWRKDNNETICLKKKTFEEHLQLIGIEKKRLCIRASKSYKKIFDLNAKQIEAGLRTYYKTDKIVVTDNVFKKEKICCKNSVHKLMFEEQNKKIENDNKALLDIHTRVEKREFTFF